jgi:hypothetical protein
MYGDAPMAMPLFDRMPVFVPPAEVARKKLATKHPTSLKFQSD